MVHALRDSNLGPEIYNSFGTVEILDDLLDGESGVRNHNGVLLLLLLSVRSSLSPTPCCTAESSLLLRGAAILRLCYTWLGAFCLGGGVKHKSLVYRLV